MPQKLLHWPMNVQLGLGLGLTLAWIGFGPSLGLDFWNVPHLHQKLAAAEEKREELSLVAELTHDRIRLKRQAIADLIAGNSDFPSTVELVKRIAATDPVLVRYIRLRYPGSTDSESFARHVLQLARVQILYHGNDQPELLSKIESEYASFLAESHSVAVDFLP